jgi:hypothetical protein
MRLLTFNVESQCVHKDPNCDFTNIVAGTKNYLRAKFTFSDEWRDCVKVASFWRGEKEYAAVLNSDGICDIPPEALIGATFRVSVIGQKQDYRITTNKIVVRQEVPR